MKPHTINCAELSLGKKKRHPEERRFYGKPCHLLDIITTIKFNFLGGAHDFKFIDKIRQVRVLL